jgi:retinol dehydrogenase-12
MTSDRKQSGPPNAAAPVANGKLAMVTGAGGGMGRVIATELARQGATVAVVVRRHEQGVELRDEIAATLDNGRVEVLVGDLARQADVRRIAAELSARHDALQLLINNAGAHYRQRLTSPDGIEMHLAVNHLAGFLLTQLLLPALQAGAPARIVNIVSEAMRDTRTIKFRAKPKSVDIDPADLQSEHDFDSMVAYGRAKLATLMCGYLLAEQLAGTGITVNAVHPGLVSTGIVSAIAPGIARPFLGLIRRLLLSPQQGAQAALHLATAPELVDTTGAYFNRSHQQRSPDISYNRQLQHQIWATSRQLVGLDD